MCAGSTSENMSRTEEIHRTEFSKMCYSCNIANALTGKQENLDEKSVIFWEALSAYFMLTSYLLSNIFIRLGKIKIFNVQCLK